MKKVKSPTGCVHIVAGGNEKDGWITACNHRDFHRWDGYEHQWPLTDKDVTCKRCIAMLLRDKPALYFEAVIYTWPASQVCIGCTHYSYADIGNDSDGALACCEKNCKLNNGHTCPEKESANER